MKNFFVLLGIITVAVLGVHQVLKETARVLPDEYAEVAAVRTASAALGIPQLLSPTNGSTISSTPTFSWSSVTNATSYRIQVTKNTDTSFLKPVINAGPKTTSYKPSTLADGSYLWRVRAKNSTSLSVWSSVFTFTKGAVPVSLVKTAYGDLQVYVDAFVAAIPRKHADTKTDGYDVPTAVEASDMAAVMSAIKLGDLERAASLAAPYKYELIRYTDTVTGRMSTLLSEIKNVDGSWPHAWGMYLYSSPATSSTVIEVPHPLADLYTERAGVSAFRRAHAKALLIAGAHRYANQDASSDVAHASLSVFEAIHKQLITSASKVYQPHGYSKVNYSTATPADAVISSGTSVPSTLVNSANTGLRAVGFNTCVYTGDLDGTSSQYANPCFELGATTNVQGASTRSLGANFIHAEMEFGVRSDAVRFAKFTDTLVDTILK